MEAQVFFALKLNSNGSKLACTRRLRCASENFSFPGDFKVGESCSDDRRFELCFQQSAGNSARPKINFPLCLLRHFAINHDVCNLQASTGAKHAKHFGQNFLLVRRQIEYTVGDDDISPTI